MSVVKNATLFKKGSKGEIRVWRMEQDGDKHRTITGTQDGKQTESGWTTSKPKNVGKANATTGEEQAASEIANKYTKKLKSGYFEDIADVDNVLFIKPMLATKYEERIHKVPADAKIFIQPKLDGIRCIARANGLWTRQGEPMSISSAHIFDALKPLFDADPDLVLDGELYNHDFRDNFNKLGSLIRKKTPNEAQLAESVANVQYHVYDVMTDDPFEVRAKKIIELIGKNGYGPIKRVDTRGCISGNGVDDWYEIWLKAGYEGQMVRTDGPYQKDKRSPDLMKRKEFVSNEYRVIHMVEGNGNWAGCARKYVCLTDDGKEFGADVVGTQAELKKVWDSRITPDWATVEHFAQLTPDGIPRFGKAKDWGTGKRSD